MGTPKALCKYVPIKEICEELTAYGFSYKWANCAPIIQPWRLTEGKARKAGMLFEGEKAIRRFWEEKVRPKLPDEFYSRRDVGDAGWVFEARQLCGFDGPDFKDRFVKMKKPPAKTPLPREEGDAAAPVTRGEAAGETATGGKKAPLGSVAESAASGKENRAGGKPSKRRAEEEEEDEDKVGKKKVKKAACPSSASPALGPAPHKQALPPPAPVEPVPAQVRPSPQAGSDTSTSPSSPAEPSPTDQGAVKDEQPGEKYAPMLEALVARASVLTKPALEKAKALVEKGDARMVNFLRAFKGREVEEEKLTQFKRMIDTIISACGVGHR